MRLPAQVFRFGFFLAGQKLSHHLPGIGIVVEHLIGGGDDGHFHPLLLAQLQGGLGGIVALHHSAHLVHGSLRGQSLTDENTGLTVPGVDGGAGDNQVAYAGQTRQGFFSGPHGNSQPGHFGEAPGHQHGLGVVSIAQGVGAQWHLPPDPSAFAENAALPVLDYRNWYSA